MNAMHRIFAAFITICTVIPLRAQEAKTLYETGLELAKQGKAEEAVNYFDKSIEQQPTEYLAWYNRAITKVMLHRYEEALADLDKTILLNPGYKKAYLNRGTVKKHLTDYDGALADYNYVLKYDSANGENFYYRGLLFNLLGKRIDACMDFDKALHLGYKAARPEMESCARRPTANDTSVHSILRLTKTADTNTYGFTPNNPVKLGKGPESAPQNIITYLELLRDAKGQPLKYERVGTCCPYKSDHAFFGKEAMEEKYEIIYTAADGSLQKAYMYFSFFDFAEPLIPAGLNTVAPPRK